MTMKLWTLADISAELVTAPQISSALDNNLLTLNNNNLCHLPYVFPFTKSSGMPWSASGEYEGFAAIALAAQHLNTGDGSIVPEVAALANETCGIKFNVAAYDTARSESVAVNQIIQITDRKNSNYDGADNLLPCVILGAARSAVSMPTSIISGLRGFPQISPISTSPVLDDKSQFKYFARTIPNDDGTAIPLIARLNSGSGGNDSISGAKDRSESWGVNFLAVIHVDDAYGNGFAKGIQAAAQAMAPEMQVNTYTIPTNADDADIKRVIAIMKKSQIMYFFGILTPSSLVDKVMTAAAEAGIAGTGKHSWLFGDGLGKGATGRNFKVGSPLERAYRGTGMLSARGGIPGIRAFNALAKEMRELRESMEDKEYLHSLLPKYTSTGQIINHTEITESDSYLKSPGLVAPFLYLTEILKYVRWALYCGATLSTLNDDNEHVSQGSCNSLFPRSHPAPFLYDAVISGGLSACKLKMNHNTTAGSFALNGNDHYNAIVNSTFEGSSGTISFNSETGTRDPKSALFSLVNFVDDPEASTSDFVQFMSQETDVFESEAWRSLRPFVFNNGKTNVPSDLPETDVDRNYIPAGLRAVGLVLCGVIIALSVGFTVWTRKKEKLRVVRAAQPIFLYIIAIGTLLMGCTIIPLSLDPGVVSIEGASIACMSMPWLLACGFSMTFSALFTKTYRILTIMKNAAAFKRVKVTALDVVKPMVCLLLINIITLAVWTAIDPLISKTIELEANRLGQATVTENVCFSEHRNIFLSVLGVTNLGALCVAFVEAYLARNISVELSESAYIMKAIGLILMVLFMGIPVIIIASDNVSAFYFVAVAIIFTVCISILCLIFVPKVLESMKPPADKRGALGRIGCPQISRSAVSESESENVGIKILSSPVAIAQLEEENRKLKHFVIGSGRRVSSVLNDEETASTSRILSHMPNGSIAESGAVTVTERENLVTFESSNNDVAGNHTKVNTDDALEKKERRRKLPVNSKAFMLEKLVTFACPNNDFAGNHTKMNVDDVDVKRGGIR